MPAQNFEALVKNRIFRKTAQPHKRVYSPFGIEAFKQLGQDHILPVRHQAAYQTLGSIKGSQGGQTIISFQQKSQYANFAGIQMTKKK